MSFNLAPGVALGDAVTAIQNAERQIGMPSAGAGALLAMLMLCTTPVIYLYLDRLRLWASRTLPHRTPRPIPGVG